MTLRSHFLIQLSGAGLSALAFIMLTPFLVSSLGLERYGVLLLVLGFLIYSNIAELGISGAVTREIADSEEEKWGRIFGNAVILSVAFACFGGLLFASLALPAVAGTFVKDPRIIAELAQSATALFTLGALSIFGGIPRGVLFGLSRFVPLNIVGIFGTVGSLLSPAAYAAFFGKDLPGLIASVASAHFATFALAFALCLSAGARPKFQYDRPVVCKLVAYGGWSTASGVLHRLTNSLDRLLISALIGPASVPYFAIPEGALNRAHLISGALLSAAFPRMARSPNDEALIGTCYRAVLLMTPLFVIGIAVLKPLLSLWLGSEFAAASHVAAVLLAVAIWVDIIGRVPYALLQARSAMREEARIAAIILIPNLLLLLTSLYFLGVAGAAAVAIVRSLSFFILRDNVTKSVGRFRLNILGNATCIAVVALSALQNNFIEVSDTAIFGSGVSLLLACYINFRYAVTVVQEFFPRLKNLGA